MSAWGQAWGVAWGDAWGPSAPTPTVVIDTHDGADKHYRKRTEERVQLRKMLESLVAGPVSEQLVEEALAAPVEKELSEWVSALVARDKLRDEIEAEDEEIVMLAGL